MKVYVVGKVTGCNSCDAGWEIIGVFTDQKKAVDACLTKDHFVGPIEMNVAIQETVYWPNCYYPKKAS